MASIYDLSTTPANNNAAVPNGAPENWLPSNVNDWGRQLMADIIGANLAVAAASADGITYTATLNPVPTALQTNMTIFVKWGADNTSTTPTFNPNTLGAGTITKYGGQALAVGDILNGMIGIMTFVNPTWELLNPVPVPGVGAGVTSLTFNAPLSGGIVTSTGSAGVYANGILNSHLAQMPPNTVKGNPTASTANATNTTVAQLKSMLGLLSAAFLNVGTSANNVVQLDGAAKLPAVDGSRLTNLASATGAVTRGTQNSTGSNFSGGTVYTQSHALSSTPIGAWVYAECTTTELGYSVGDRVMINYNKNGTGVGVAFDATNSYILVTNGTIQIQQKNSPGGDSAITASKWKIVAIPFI